ncbi:MAG: S4 domain-containing protein [Anaerolineaceae bacterium]
MEERIQKILARAGFGSRRSSEELISTGRIKINGVTAILGSKADLAVDKITVDGRAIPSQPIPNIYIALNKPHGILSDEDPAGFASDGAGPGGGAWTFVYRRPAGPGERRSDPADQ